MKKQEFWYAKELAQHVLQECGVVELPVDVWKICKRYDIVVAPYRSEKETPGCCFIYEGVPMIFIDDRLTKEKQRFVCAHELGHVLMGHVGAWNCIADSREIPKHIKERSAMAFAFELLVKPMCT